MTTNGIIDPMSDENMAPTAQRLNEIWDEGQDAAEDGLPEASNPYRGSAATAWEDGHRDETAYLLACEKFYDENPW